MWRRVVSLEKTDVSEVRTSSIIRAINKPRAKGIGYIENPWSK
jgi:hypothetical protein